MSASVKDCCITLLDISKTAFSNSSLFLYMFFNAVPKLELSLSVTNSFIYPVISTKN